jgi:hypothetical protein
MRWSFPARRRNAHDPSAGCRGTAICGAPSVEIFVSDESGDALRVFHAPATGFRAEKAGDHYVVTLKLRGAARGPIIQGAPIAYCARPLAWSDAARTLQLAGAKTPSPPVSPTGGAALSPALRDRPAPRRAA